MNPLVSSNFSVFQEILEAQDRDLRHEEHSGSDPPPDLELAIQSQRAHSTISTIVDRFYNYTRIVSLVIQLSCASNFS
jgi:hypothetical protein